MLVTFAVAFGLVFGSFLNVVIHRVPLGQNVAHPPSACPKCGKPIAAYDNIPVLSWLILGGKGRCCKTPIAARYPAVELLGGVMAWAMLEGLVLSDPERPLLLGVALFFVYTFFALTLVALVFIDLEHMLLPDSLTLPLGVVGLLTAPLRDIGLVDVASGALLGYLIVWGPFIWLYARLRGHAGMGLGDAKLLCAIGCWFGPPGVLFALLAGSVQGTGVALVVFALRGKLEEPASVQAERREIQEHLAALGEEERAQAELEFAQDPLAFEAKAGLGQARLAFGPFLALAALEYALWGEALLDWMWHS